ncbi:hypothetical protein ACFQH6_18430 [Halobacteriaceae archaeon GCM10025711]
MSSEDELPDADRFEWLADHVLGEGEDGPEWPHDELEHVIEAYDDHPDRCIIYPRDLKHEEDITEWVAAREGSFVDPDGMR